MPFTREDGLRYGKETKRGPGKRQAHIKKMVTDLVEHGMAEAIEKLKDIDAPEKYLDIIT